MEYISSVLIAAQSVTAKSSPASMLCLPEGSFLNADFIVSTYVTNLSGFRKGGEPANEVGNGWGAYDNGLSDAHLILKAREMGFDTLIMGGRDATAIRSIFNIPESETIMAVIALGYRAADPQRPARKPLDEIVTFF